MREALAMVKRPEFVLIIVSSSDAEILMLRRRHPPGFWQSVTGSLKWDELPRKAAICEPGEGNRLER